MPLRKDLGVFKGNGTLAELATPALARDEEKNDQPQRNNRPEAYFEESIGQRISQGFLV